MSLFSSSRQSFLGIDIGSTSVKLVELQNTNGVPELVTYGYAEFPSSIPHNRSAAVQAAVSVTLKQVMKKAKTKSKQAYTALATDDVFSSILSIPKLPKKEFKVAINKEAKKLLPLSLDEMTIDPQVLDKSGSDGSLNVLLVGAPKTVVQYYADIFKRTGLNLLGLETEGFALIRSLVGRDSSPVAIVDMGATTTDIIIAADTTPMLNRSIKIGGQQVTEAFVKTLGVDETTAEQMKRDAGLGGDGRSPAGVPKMAMDTLTPIVNEIRYTTELFIEQGGKKIEKVILTGGSAMLHGFPEYLGSVLNTRVYVGDPWARVRYPVELKGVLQESAARFGAAVGLGMRAIK